MKYIMLALTLIVVLSVACGIVALRKREKQAAAVRSENHVRICDGTWKPISQGDPIHFETDKSYTGYLTIEVCDENNPKAIKPTKETK